MDAPLSPSQGRRPPGLDRRRTLLGGLAGAALLLPPAARLVAATPPADLLFDVFRRGRRIGSHRVTFTPSEGGFVATTAIELAVRVAFVTAYRYRQDGRATWHDGVLVGGEIETNDDGTETKVQFARTGERLEGSGPRGRIDLPLGAMTDLDWWNPTIMERPRLIDGQNGGVNYLHVEGPRPDPVRVGGTTVDASRWSVAAGSQSGSIWYDENGRWVRTILRTKGEELTYEPAA